jgi:Uma2 family endonuclease
VAVAREHFDRGASVRVPLSYEEWRSLGETKHQEWSEGVLYVNPPSRWHVLVSKHLARVLDDACPDGLTVYPDWGFHTAVGDFEPDLMIAPDDLPDESYVAVAPLLIVEVASPTTRDLDWDRKLRAYAQAGVAWYWIVERDSLTVFANRDGRFEEIQRLDSGEAVDVVGPFTVRLDPGTLARR